MKIGKSTKILIILSVILLIAFSGCTAPNEQVIETPDGDIKITEGSGSGPDWCKAGTTMTTTGPDGEQSSLRVKGIVNYEGRQVCESVIEGSAFESSGFSATVYMNEDSTYSVMILKDASGKVINTIDTSQP